MISKIITPLIVVILFFCNQRIQAQVDTEFWFVAPEITPYHDHPGGRPIRFIITNMNPEVPGEVTIAMPNNPLFDSVVVKIPAGIPQIVDVSGPNVGDESIVENQMNNLDSIAGKSNKGIHITSNAFITVGYEVSSNMGNNVELFSLKGKNGLGNEFYTIFQNSMYNHPISTVSAYSAFDIVFTQDNTELWLDIPTGLAVYPNLTGDSVYVGTFNKGETYHGAPVWLNNTEHVTTNTQRAIDYFGRAGKDHLSGVRVYTRSNKKIAMTLKDDSMKSLVGGCYDIVGDQNIPANLIGNEYIAMRGNLSSGSPNVNLYPPGTYIQERVYLVGTKDGDSIFINGVFYKTLNKQQTVFYELTSNFNHIRTKNNAYAWQITGNGCEFGGAVLPPIATYDSTSFDGSRDLCSGSTRVAFTRLMSGNYYMNILVRKGAENSFLLNNRPFDSINATWISKFVPVPGEEEWLAARIGPITTSEISQNTPQLLVNTKDVFHLGIIDATGGGTRYAYFSNYGAFKMEVINSSNGTSSYYGYMGDTIQLMANGGTNIHWQPVYYLDDPYKHAPKAISPFSMVYMAYSMGMCKMKDSAIVNIDLMEPVSIESNKSNIGSVNSCIYPNPAQYWTNIDYKLEPGEVTDLSIFTLQGNLVEKKLLDAKQTTLKLNLQNYKPGVYLYQYKDKKGKFVVR